MVDMEAGNLRITMRELSRGIVLLVGVGLTIAGGVWTAATWKTSLEEHLNRIDDHLHNEDEQIIEQNHKLQWLIDNHPSAKDAPTKGRPMSRNMQPDLTALLPPQIAHW